jgi:transcriptional regulator with XRE-family HTH domain
LEPQEDKSPTVLQARVTERLETLGLKPAPASIKAGVHKDTVRNILRGRSAHPAYETLAALAQALECAPGYLTGDQADAMSHPNASVEAAGAERLIVRHEVGAGYWRSSVNQLPLGEGVVAPAEEYSNFAQWLEKVLGRGFDTEYPEGTLIHVVDASAIGHAPRQGDHVVVTRIRADGEASERSIREVTFDGARRLFTAKSTDPELNGAIELGPHDRVAALILGSYRPRR